MHQRVPIQERLENTKKDGTRYHANISLQPVDDKRLPDRLWIGCQQDFSDSQEMSSQLAIARQELNLYKQRLWDAIEALPDAFVMFNAENRLVVCNNKYKEFYAASAPAIHPGAAFEDIMRFGLENGQYPEAQGREEVWLQERLDRSKRTANPTTRELPGGRHVLIHDIVTSNGDVVGLRTDVTELQKKKNDLELLSVSLAHAKEVAEAASRTDPLTGVGNRRGLDTFMAKLIKPIIVETQIALIHIDLDHFKQINDQYGHAAGDEVLCEVADIFRKSTRPEDFVARVGGDEFVIVLLSNKAQRAAKTVAKRIIAACKKAFRLNEHKLEFSTSIGIAISDNGEFGGLRENADSALYEAKSAGRGKYVCFGH